MSNPPVVICSRNSAIRTALSRWLDCYAFKVLVECEDAQSAMDCVKEMNPHFLISDIDLDVPAAEFCRQIRLESKSKVIFFGDVYSCTRYYHRIIRGGAAALMLKASSYLGWMYALQKANDEPVYVDPPLLDLLSQPKKFELNNFSDQEFQILIRIAMPDDELAEELGIHIDFVKSTVDTLKQRFKAPTKTIVCLKVMHLGLTPLPCAAFLARDPNNGLSVEEVDSYASAENAIHYVDEYWKRIRGAD